MEQSSGSSNQTIQFDEAAYKAILALAENYRTANPPRIQECLHCLISVLYMNPSPPAQVFIRIHYQLGSLTMKHTKNYDHAITHLQNAITIARQLQDEQSAYEAVSLLAECYMQSSKTQEAKSLLNEAISATQQLAYWHIRLIFQLTKIHHEEGNFPSASQLLDHGANISRNYGLSHLRILFLLSKGMVFLIQQNLNEVNKVLSLCGQLIDDSRDAPKLQVASLRVYFLTLQVAHLLSGGQVKSVKSSLKLLQQSMQELSLLREDECQLIKPRNHDTPVYEYDDLSMVFQQLTSMDAFAWLPREYMYILVYLTTVTHAMLAGCMDKAQKYSEKALEQINILKATDKNPLLTRLELMFYENMAQCRLVMCDKRGALARITKACKLCAQHSNVPQIMQHTRQIHTLLGMYAMSINSLKDAEKQLKLAVEQSITSEQSVTNLLNLALVHIHSFQLSNGKTPHLKHQELIQILSKIPSDTSALKSRNLKAALYYVKGMFAFFQSHHNEAKRFLHEALKLSNQQDLHRLTACSFVLLSHVHLAIGDRKESLDKVNGAMEISKRIPDPSLQLWSASLLRDLYRSWRDEKNYHQFNSMHEQIENCLLKDNAECSSLPQHSLTKWSTDPLPPSQIIELPFDVGEKYKLERSCSSSSSNPMSVPPPVPEIHPQQNVEPITNHKQQQQIEMNQERIPELRHKPESMDTSQPVENMHHVEHHDQLAEMLKKNDSKNQHYNNHHQSNEIRNEGTQQANQINDNSIIDYAAQYLPQPQQQETNYSNQKHQQQQLPVAAGMYQPPASHLHPSPNVYSNNSGNLLASPTQHLSPTVKPSDNRVMHESLHQDALSQLQHYNNTHHTNQSIINQQPTYDSSYYPRKQNSTASYNPHGMTNSGLHNTGLDHISTDHLMQQTEGIFAHHGHRDSHAQAQQQFKNLQQSEIAIDHVKHPKQVGFMPDVNRHLLGFSQHSQQQQQMYLSHHMRQQGVTMQNMYAQSGLLPQHNIGIGYSPLGGKFQMPPGLSPQEQQAWLTSQNYGHADSTWR